MMFNFDINAIYTLVMSMIPTLANIVMLIVGFKKIFKTTTDIEIIKAQYNAMSRENSKLRKQVNELLTKLDNVKRGE